MFVMDSWKYALDEINRNMRCIEIQFEVVYAVGRTKINRNMRCIEIL